MASEEDLAASLQRSQSTPEPLFGQPDLELTKFQNSRIQHSSNGKTLKEGQKNLKFICFTLKLLGAFGFGLG